MIRVSTAYKYVQMQALADLFEGAVFRFYSGPMPAAADAQVTGDYLAYITNNGLPVNFGNGLSFLPATNGFATLMTGVNAVLTARAAGTLGYARLSAVDDDGSQSLTRPRIDFEVDGLDNNGIILPVRTVAPGLTKPLSGFYFTIPG